MSLQVKADLKDRSRAYSALISLLKNGREHGVADALIRAKLDWSFILDKSVQEGVFYPFYRNLLLLDEELKFIPVEPREKFRQTYYLHISQSAVQFSRVERVLERVEALKIKTLLFKGPAIDYFIYDEFSRPRLDLDIAVGKEEVSSLEKSLFSLGYSLPREDADYPLPEYLNSRLFLPGCADFIPVHIHKHLINNMFLSVDRILVMEMEEVWGQTEPFKDYRYICVLKPELNIIYLCEHGLKHNFEQIVFLYEIAGLIRYYQNDLDWQKLAALARSCGLGRAVYYGLYFVKNVLSADVPEEIIAGLKPKRFTAGEKVFIKNTLEQKYYRYASYPVYLAMRRGLLKKTNFVFRTVFPPGFTFQGYLLRMSRLILA